MRILFFSDNFPPEQNAAANRVSERAIYWVKWGHQVTVITSFPNFPQGQLFEGYKNRLYSRENYHGIDVVRVKTFIAPNEGFVLRTIDFLSFMVMAFFASLFLKKPDVVAVTSPQFFAAISAWAAAKVKRTPFVFEVGDLWPESIKAVGVLRDSILIRWLEWIELFLYSQAQRIVVLTEAFKNNLIGRGVEPSKIHVIINGVELNKYSFEPKETLLVEQLNLKEKFVVGYIGTLGLAHDLENVLRAARILTNQFHIHFMFVGPGAARENLIRMSKELELSNVTFLPMQPKSEIKRYWSLCDMALIHLKNTPVFETVIPSKLFEAMAMEIPILMCGPDGEAAKIVREKDCGVSIPSNNPRILAEAVSAISSNKSLLVKYSKNCKRSAPEYTREVQSKKYILSLEPLMDRI